MSPPEGMHFDMFVVIWSYVVDAESAVAFERAYAPDGEWTALFRQSPDFFGTELLREADGSFITIDRWRSAEAYDSFVAKHASDYQRLDKAGDRLTRSERRVGRFVSVPPALRCTLRAVTEDDLPIFFEHQRDEEAARMAVFPSRTREAFMTHWREKILANPANHARTIVVDGEVAGNIGSWEQDGRQLVGYWIGREHWRKGVATEALSAFVPLLPVRPLYAWVAESNVASARVLEKCGFGRCNVPGHASNDGIAEFLYKLDRA